MPDATALHCIAKYRSGYWSAYCLDFSLYATGETLDEATEKLGAQVMAYLYDAIEGEDREFAPQLLLRRAPWRDWAEWHLLSAMDRFEWLGGIVRSRLLDLALPQPPYRHA